MWHDLITMGVPVAEKVIRTVAVYAFMLVGLRLAGKRELGQLNPFDLIVLLLLANTLHAAIVGNDGSLVGGVLTATLLLALNWVVVKSLYAHPRLAERIVGCEELLIDQGRVRDVRLRRELITRGELEAAARRQGIEGLHLVQECRLEIGGALTFVPVAPSADEHRHHEILERLDALLAAQRALTERVVTLEANGRR